MNAFVGIRQDVKCVNHQSRINDNNVFVFSATDIIIYCIAFYAMKPFHILYYYLLVYITKTRVTQAK